MAHIWAQPGQSSPQTWCVHPLNGPRFFLTADSERPLNSTAAGNPSSSTLLLLRTSDRRGEQWLLLTGSDSRALVNGISLPLGIRALHDRDELLLVSDSSDQNSTATEASPADDSVRRLFFSTERLARVEPLVAGNKPICCARCKRPIAPGDMAVRCPSPQCGLWHHESPDKNCWTYIEHCALCDQPTSLEAGYRWTPESL